ncbi:glycosyltransferase [Leptolyngbya sp. O-77]|uniref:glycosyltransferase n=1 Tax=Leptolyngbya sp. O-77 TaxID=1080068 RepID=UPI00074D2956|nr:glycosyltransferase [Leptolyngbya sp. O-77]BAU44002.1 Lipopolysaccharide core biosynthesis protein RfaG [Leptolyngbya sp. O-77]
MNKTRNISILVNRIAPYRLPIYQAIGDQFNLFINYGGGENNRSTWKDLEKQLRDVKARKSWGWIFRFKEKRGDSLYDYKFLHITPGFFIDLLHQSPDIIISHELGFRTFIAIVYGLIYRKPVWVWWGGTLHTERSAGNFKKILRLFLSKFVKKWISYGQTSTEYLLSIGVDRNKILQIQNCVDEKLYSVNCTPLIDLKPKPVFLYVGQLISRKGVDKLLESLALLQVEGYDFSILLVGEGGEREFLESLASKLELSNVLFYPAQSPMDMVRVYKSADYLVFPTLEDVWGLVVNEAILSGINVLSSVYAGCSTELLPPQNIFDPLNSESFLAILKSALENRLPKPDLSRVITSSEVAGTLIKEIEQELL